MIFLAPILFGIASAVITRIAAAIGVTVIRNALISGGLAGVARAIFTVIVTRAIAYFSIARITQYFWSTVEYFWNFNWNITDQEIDQQIKAQFNSLASILGAAVGTTIGGLTCSAGMLYINQSALMYLDDITEELSEEIIAAWASVLRSSIRVLANSLWLWGYKSIRNFLKDSGIAAMVLGEKAVWWGTKNGGGVSSFAKSWENWVESLPEPLSQFIEEASEEAIEFCKEMTLLIADRADMALGLQRQGMRDRILGDETIVEVQPNRNVNETIVLAGREELVRSQMVQTLTQHQLMGNRDVGINFNGEDYTEHNSRKDPSQISIVFKMAPNNRKPYFRPVNEQQGNLVIKRQLKPEITVHYVQKTKLDWQRLKDAVGGINGYIYGRHLCVLHLTKDGGNRGTISCWADTYDNAKDICVKLAALTDCDISHANKAEEVEMGNRSTQRNNMKLIHRVYPYRAIINVGVDTTTTPRQTGRKVLTSPQATKIIRDAIIDLTPDTPPTNFQARIDALFMLMQ